MKILEIIIAGLSDKDLNREYLRAEFATGCGDGYGWAFVLYPYLKLELYKRNQQCISLS